MLKKESFVAATYGKRRNFKKIKSFIILLIFISMTIALLLMYNQLSINSNVISSPTLKEKAPPATKTIENTIKSQIESSNKSEVIKKSQPKTQLPKEKTTEELTKKQEENILLLSESQFISELPRSSIISLKVGDSHFTIQKSKIELKNAIKPDITIYIPQNYFNEPSNNLCNIAKSASSKNDLYIETHLSKSALTWKYASMYKYRSCLGI